MRETALKEALRAVVTLLLTSLLTVDIQTSFHLIIGILDMEVAPIKSVNCADWPSKASWTWRLRKYSLPIALTGIQSI